MKLTKYKHLGRVADILIIAVGVFTLWRFFGANLISDAKRPPERLLAVGGRLELPDVRWAGSERHMVARLSTTCAACNESLGFYRSLMQRAIDSKVPVYVVTNESVETARTWLAADAGIHFIEVADPGAMGFLLIPTLFMVDSQGRITDAALSKLSQLDEQRFVDRVTSTSAALFDNTLFAQELTESAWSATRSKDVLAIDVSARDQFTPRAGIINIPSNEMDVLAPMEIPPGASVAISCRASRLTECRLSGRILRQKGYSIVIAVF